MTQPGNFDLIYQASCPAKINLTLDILSRLPNGYHQLASVVHPVGLTDDLKVEFNRSGGVVFSCSRADLEGDDNLCVKALKTWNKSSGANIGATIHLEKRIPTGAGLGGGSSNAAAMLQLLHKATGSSMSQGELLALGASLGADVPLFLQGDAVLMEGIGEKITPLTRISGWVVILKPELSLSTPAVYRAWDEGHFTSERATAAMLEVWKTGDLRAICTRLGNDLERAVAGITDIPTRLTAVLRTSGAVGAQMSGSGSACFGIYETEEAAHAAGQLMEEELAKDVQLHKTEIFVAPL